MKAIKDTICKQIADLKGIDQRVVRLIADSPIKFFKNRASDDTDTRPIRVRYFAAFVPKTSYVNYLSAKDHS